MLLPTLALVLIHALPPGVAELARRLAARPAFECDFVQERSLAGLRNPLKSSGTFRLEPGQRASWIQLKPVPQTILLRRDGMELLRPDGTSQKLSASAPVAGEIARALYAMTQGDLQGLAGTFEVEWVRRKDDDWALRLSPKGIARNAFREIVLSGAADLGAISLLDGQGLPTRIVFTSPRPLGKAP
jgi:hypothetical protein